MNAPLPASSDLSQRDAIRALVDQGREQSGSLTELRDLAADVALPRPIRAHAIWALSRHEEPRAGRIWHVDQQHPAADDTGLGDGHIPKRTIQAAVWSARAGDTILVHPGCYRERVAPCTSGTPDAPITLAAAEPGVEITAADEWRPTWQAEGGGVWSCAWQALSWDIPGRFGPPVPAARCEQVWVGGRLLQLVADAGALRLQPWRMCVDDAAGRLWISLPDGDAAPRGVERAQRRQCLAPAVRGLGHWHVRGLHLRGGAAHRWTGVNWLEMDQFAVFDLRGGHQWLIEECLIRDGNAQGMQVGAGGFSRRLQELPRVAEPLGGTVVRGCTVIDHGIAGIVAAGGANGLVIEGCVVSGNGRLDNRGTYEEAAIKLHGIEDSIIRGNRIERNRSFGIWLDYHCARNRIIGNLLRDNDDHQIFHEISQGPLLVDGNVVVETRTDAAPGACGFYTHDGNGAVVVNNAFIGCPTGVRIRALFHRRDGDQLTATNDNLIACNYLVGWRKASVSLMPERRRCERNAMRDLLLWAGGAPVTVLIENGSDVGLPWEETELGRRYGWYGGGDRSVAPEFVASGSLAIAPVQVGGLEPEQWLRRLAVAGPQIGIPAAGGYRPVDPPAAAVWLAALAPELAGWSRHADIALSPASGLQRWVTPAGPQTLRWQGDTISPLAQALIGEPDPRASGAVLVTSLPITGPGIWANVIGTKDCWRVDSQIVREPLRITHLNWRPVGLDVEIEHHGSHETPIEVSRHGAFEAVVAMMPASGVMNVLLPMPRPACGWAQVEVAVCSATAGNVTATALLPCAVAATSWEESLVQPLDAFPDGAFPAGIEFSRLYTGCLRAQWSAIHSADALSVRVVCTHAIHRAFRSDMDGIHCHDGVKICLKGRAGGRATVVGLALHSETGEVVAGLNKSADDERFPIGPCAELLAAHIERRGNVTTYDVAIPWALLGLSAAPLVGAQLPCSILVTKDDGDAEYGLQWFFGILYDHREGDESLMGRLTLI